MDYHWLKIFSELLLKKLFFVGVAVQMKVDRCRDKNQYLVVGFTGRKVLLMYQ